MMSVPEAIMNRRAEVVCAIGVYQDAIRLNESDLGKQRAMVGRLIAQLGDIDLCIAAIEDAAVAASGGAGVGEAAVSGTPQGGEQTQRLVGTGSDPMVSGSGAFPEAKKPRAPKRDIRGMVMHWVAEWPERVQTTDGLAEAIGVSRRVVEKAVAYWQAKGRLALDGDVVRLRTAAPDADGYTDHPQQPAAE